MSLQTDSQLPKLNNNIKLFFTLLISNNTKILHLSDISHSIPGYFDDGPNSKRVAFKY